MNNSLYPFLSSILLGLVFSIFFVYKNIGLSLFVYVVIFLVVFLLLLKKRKEMKNGFSIFILVCIVLLGATFFIFNNRDLTIINKIMLPCLIIYYICLINYGFENFLSLKFLKMIMLKITTNTMTSSYQEFKECIENSKTIQIKKGYEYKSVFIGVAISMPLIFIILNLLNGADLVFNYYIENGYNYIFDFNKKKFLVKVVVFLFMSFYYLGFFKEFNKVNVVTKLEKRNMKCKIEALTVLTILFFILIIYVVFSFIQFKYLYSNVTNNMPGWWSYAKYARKGFFELIIVSMINFTLLGIFTRYTKKGKLEKSLKTAYSLLLICTANILASAFYRMNLYEEKYGYTTLRLFVKTFLCLLGVTIIIVLVSIWVKKIPASKAIIICSLILYLCLNYINVDDFIAKRNIGRYENGYGIDMGYMSTLSCDCTNQLFNLINSNKPLVSELSLKALKTVEDKTKPINHWYEYNFYRYKLKNKEDLGLED